MNLAETIQHATTWILPVIFAITLHEAAHGFAAKMLGDNTASLAGRVSLNPLRHVDPIGTILLPGMLLLSGTQFLFGWAKPVPVNFANLHRPRIDMILVAAAGPGMNIVLAIIAAALFHTLDYVPEVGAEWFAQNLQNAIIINIVLALFNLLPIPPLDGGRILVGILPRFLAMPLARLEPYGMMIIIVVMIVIPFVTQQFGMRVSPLTALIGPIFNAVVSAILALTGFPQS
jgi:Zn-dependent protease